MYDILELNKKLLPELKEIAKELKIKRVEAIRKQDLIYKILDQQAIISADSRSKDPSTSKSQSKSREKPMKRRDSKPAQPVAKDGSKDKGPAQRPPQEDKDKQPRRQFEPRKDHKLNNPGIKKIVLKPKIRMTIEEKVPKIHGLPLATRRKANISAPSALTVRTTLTVRTAQIAKTVQTAETVRTAEIVRIARNAASVRIVMIDLSASQLKRYLNLKVL